MTKKRYRILVILIAAGFIAGRLAMRAIGNLILGGTLFGGNISTCAVTPQNRVHPMLSPDLRDLF